MCIQCGFYFAEHGFLCSVFEYPRQCIVTTQTLSLGRQPNLQLLFYYFDETEILRLLHPNTK
jgi:hypothetical protein